MGFRRSPEAARTHRDWKSFVGTNGALLRSTGMPEALYEFHALFEDYLMHGYIDHHPDTTGFHAGEMSADQLEAMFDLVAAYLKAGLGGESLCCFPNVAYVEEARRRAGLSETRNLEA